MPSKLSKVAREKRNEKEILLQAFLEAFEELGIKTKAYERVSDEHNVTVERIKHLVRVWRPQKDAPLRTHGNSRLNYEQESLTVGLILGMSNISKPLDVKSLLKIVNKRYRKEGKKFSDKWFRGFYSRWSNTTKLKETRLISVGSPIQII
jgi:hypothetical protein